MTDATGTPRPWDLEQFRGIKEKPDFEAGWEAESELVLGQGNRSDDAAHARYDRNGPSLFWLALRTAILTVLTLGIYRFWMTTQLRRHYWKAIRIQGDPLEYTGTGLEKILGFLVAIVILAIYLGFVNLVLAFIGLSYFGDDPLALNITILAAMPLFFFAAYRARRYVMARTRWRGIRFGMDHGATGYMLRAIWLWFLTIVTAGLLYPYQQFKLAKYMADRTWYGDMKFEQHGSWTRLFAYWVWIYIVVGLMVLAGWGMAADQGNPSTAIIGLVLLFAGYLGLVVLILRYDIVVFRYMWSNRSLGGTQFLNDVKPGQIISVYVFGSLGVLVCSLLVAAVLLGAAAAVVAAMLGPDWFGNLSSLDAAKAVTADWRGLAILGAAYLSAIAASYAFSQVFMTRPILQRKVEAMVIHNVRALTASRQRAHDHAAEAGGFADALGVDVGAGI